MVNSYEKPKTKGSFFNSILQLLLLLAYAAYSYYHLIYRYVFPRRLKSLDGEVFLITGSASGIGREVVFNLAKNHPKTTLVLWDCSASANQQVVEDVKLLGVDVFSYTLDLSDRLQVEECARKVFEEVGIATIIFNNAGVAGLGELLTQPPEKIEKTMSVNVLSHFWVLRAFLPEMIEQNYGHIVTTCSVAGYLGLPYDVPYCASKFAVRGYLESLKAELRYHPLKPKIKFTTVFPSFVKTPLTARVACQFQLQFLFDPLEPRYVAEQIILGIRRNEENVFIPKSFELLVLMKAMAPKRLYEKFEEFMVESIHLKEEKVQQWSY